MAVNGLQIMRTAFIKRNVGVGCDCIMGEENERNRDIGSRNRYGGAFGCFIYCKYSLPTDSWQEDQGGIVKRL